MNVRRVPVVLVAVAATTLAGLTVPVGATASPAPPAPPATTATTTAESASPVSGVAARVTAPGRVEVTWSVPTRAADASDPVEVCRVDGRRSVPLLAADCSATVPAAAGDARVEDPSAQPGRTYTYAVVGATTAGTPVTVVVPRDLRRSGAPAVANTGTGSVRGTVTTTAGAPVRGARAVLFGYGTDGLVTLGTATTGANGVYRVAGVAGGIGQTAFLCVDAHDAVGAPAGGFVDACAGEDAVWDGLADDLPYTAAFLTVADGIDLNRVDVALATGATVTGVVTAGATRVAGASVYAVGRPETTPFRAVTDANGAYVLEGVPAGVVTVCVDASDAPVRPGRPGYAPGCQGGTSWDGRTVQVGTPSLALAAGSTQSVDVGLRAGAAIGGRVTDTDGVPLAGVVVYATVAPDEPLYFPPGGSGPSGDVSHAVTGADGRYVVTGLLPGRYATCFDATSARGGTAAAGHLSRCSGGTTYGGGYAFSVPVTAPRTTAVTGTTVTSDIALPAAGGLNGRVTDSRGRGLARVEVRAYGAGSGGSTTTAADGAFTVDGLVPGSYVVCLEASASGTGTVRGFADECSGDVAWDGGSAPPAAATPVTVTTGARTDASASLGAGGAVTGTVTAGGAPRAGADVSVWRRGGDRLPQRTVTGADGTYTVRGLATGNHLVCVDPDPRFGTFTGYTAACAPTAVWADGTVPPASAADVAVRAGATTSGVDVTLSRGTAVSGKVTSADGAPLRGVSVSAQGSSYGFATTDSAGRYTLAGLAPGSVTVCFDASVAAGGPSATGYTSECYDDVAWRPGGFGIPAAADPVTTTAGRTVTGIDATLAPAGALAGVAHPAGVPAGVPGVQVWAYDASDVPVASASTALDGSFVITGVDPGRYRVCAERSRGGGPSGTSPTCSPSVAWNGSPPSTAAAYTVTAGTVTSGVDVALQTGGAVNGVVRSDGSGNRARRVDGAYVSVFDGNGQVVARDTTAVDGSYLVAGLATGPYRVCVAPGRSLPGVLAGGYRPECHDDQAWDGVEYRGPAAGTAATTVTAGAVTRVDFSLSPGAGLHGVVTQAGSSSPVGRARIAIFEPTAGRMVGQFNGRSDGGWLVTDLVPGSYVVCVDASDALTASATGVLSRCSGDVPWDGFGVPTGATPVTAVAGDVRDVALALPVAGGVRGTIRGPDGEPVAASVTVFDADRGRQAAGATTSADGSYRVTGLATGRYRVCAQAFDFGASAGGYRPTCAVSTSWNGFTPVPAGAAVYQVVAGASAGPVDITLPSAGAVSGTVVDAVSGDPLSSVQVFVAPTGGTGGYVFTDGAGRWSARGLTAGSYTACTSSNGLTTGGSPAGYLDVCWRDVVWPGYGTAPGGATSIPVSTGQVSGGIALRLPRAAGLSGRVTVAGSGVGVGGAAVTVFRGATRVPSTSGSNETADDGSYTIGGLPAGSYTVCFDARYASGSPGSFSECHDDVTWDPTGPLPPGTTPVALTAGAVRTLDASLTPAAGLAGVATDVDGGLLRFVDVYVYRAGDGRFVGNAITGADGRYAVSGLPAGRYVVCGDAASAGVGSSTTGYLRECHGGVAWGGPPAGMPSGATPVAAGAGRTTTVDLAFPPAAAVTAIVTDTAGNPLTNVEVSVFDADGVIQVDAFTDDGRLGVTGLPVGSYLLCFDTLHATGGSSHSGYRRECYDDVAWNGGSGSPPAPDATPVALTAGVTTTVRAALAAG